ncbi:MAG: anthranilate synthase component I family protein [Verrucomicrobiota bacterium]|jgi:para-aminobenzoate synthetase component 1
MRPQIQEVPTTHTPESLAAQLLSARQSNLVLLRTASFDSPSARYSFVAANPFLVFRSFGSRCEITQPASRHPRRTQFGNPWQVLDALLARCELLDEVDLPFPLGGCFGTWGYGLKNFTEPKLPRRVTDDLELPDCHVGFYRSLVVFDHQLGKVFVISTGLDADGSRSEVRARNELDSWQRLLTDDGRAGSPLPAAGQWHSHQRRAPTDSPYLQSTMSRADFIAAVESARRYIQAGDIYQVNLSQRLTAPFQFSRLPRRSLAAEPAWELFKRLSAVSPAPFAAFLDCHAGHRRDDFQIASSSPEQFLRLSGSHVITRPIKGTRPRHADPTRDAQLACELQTSPKELAELVMITDLLRNDLGKVCEFGSVQTPELARLEKFAQVQHLVSTVQGRLRPGVTHLAALAACFPGGSITGAPKFRAMEIIDELEPLARGPYCGCHGYLGFNHESQLSITIRTAICRAGWAHFNVGAGIVADSNPQAEYDETLAKAAGFLAALRLQAEKPAKLVHFVQ